MKTEKPGTRSKVSQQDVLDDYLGNVLLFSVDLIPSGIDPVYIALTERGTPMTRLSNGLVVNRVIEEIIMETSC